MLRILIAFLVLLGAVYIGTQLNYDPGYVLIAINHWTVETTLWFTLFSLILLFLIFHILMKLGSKIANTPHTISTWHNRRLAAKAQATTRKGLIEYSEGYWEKAQNHLIQALPNADTPLLNYLTAARAAQKMGDSQLRDHFLREAQQSMPEAKIAVELTQAQLQLANNQWEQALATLRHLQDLAPKHPYVIKLLMYLYQEVKDWQQLILLFPDIKRNTIISHDEFEKLQIFTYLNAMSDLIRQNQTTAVTALFKSLPKTAANAPEMVAKYARFLIDNNEISAAEELLRRALKKEYHPVLIKIYSEPLKNETQLAFAESLLKKNPHCAELYLCLGRICIAEHLWGKAKNYLQQSIDRAPTAPAYNMLGTLHEHLNEPLVACNFYKEGLALIIHRDNSTHY